MRLIAVLLGVLLNFGIFCYNFAEDRNSARAIQIITPTNHSFQLEFSELKSILETDDIKDRHCVVVSIAGAYRKGKSFLLNFFVNYLNAQYKRHNVTDWMGEGNNSTRLNGFKYRGGRRPETTGIWMWSEIFTHDFENGDKVAIILFDTQGMFESRLSLRDCSTIFGLSMLLSSIQCFNVMQNIQENDLQNLEMFIEYGRLALEESDEKPFQKMLFIVRDWPYAFETDYGWHGQEVVEELLIGDVDQTPEMGELRQRINSSFEEIGAFLLPYPGRIVANGNQFTGDLQQIATEFRDQVKELVPSLFAPENLIVKQINGQQLRARDLVHYIQSYVDIFNGDSLPEPKFIFKTTVEVSHLILHNDCLDNYTIKMQQSFDNVLSYIRDTKLMSLHQNVKNVIMKQFRDQQKLGNANLILGLQLKIENDIERKFQYFKRENDRMRRDSFARVEANHLTIYKDCLDKYTQAMQNTFDNVQTYMKRADLANLHQKTKADAIQLFHEKAKLGDDNLISELQIKIENEIEKSLDNFKEKNKRMRNDYIEKHVKKYGWLRMTFRDAVAASILSGSSCDVIGYCDAYIKIYVNDALAFQSKTVWDTINPSFGDTFTSSKIQKNSRITIEMWDRDRVSHHEQILSRDSNIDELLTNGNPGALTIYGRGTYNELTVDVSWTDAPVELDET